MNNMFIRTKDGVYDTEKLIYRRIEGNKLYRVGWDVEKPTFEADIIKQSDNLAELIDEFVYNNQILSEEDRYNEEYLSQLYCFNDIFGAIWCEWGLKYVAKMDNDGKLILI